MNTVNLVHSIHQNNMIKLTFDNNNLLNIILSSNYGNEWCYSYIFKIDSELNLLKQSEFNGLCGPFAVDYNELNNINMVVLWSTIETNRRY